MLAVLSVLFITLVSLPQTAMAKAWKAYVVEDDTTLTFYYDAKWGTRSGTTYDIDAKQADDPKCPAWAGSSTTTTTTPNVRITKVVFDSSFKAYKPTSTERWFFKCTKVVSFEGIENLCTDQVTDMSLMFYGCESLKTIDVSYFNTANVKEMEHMFAECYKLTTIYCDEDWNDRTNRGGLMFNRCYSLKGIARYQDKSDKLNLNMANAATGYFTSKAYVVVNDGTLTFYYGTDRTTCTGSKYGIYQTWPIEGLEDCPIWTIQYDIKKVVFDKSFQVFKPTTTENWFSGFRNLSSILALDYLCTDRVTTMNGMFRDCRSLPYINMVKFNTSNVTDMSAMFYGCSSLEMLTVSKFDVSKVTNMSEMFYGCTALHSIFCNDDWNSGTVTNSTNMFYHCTKLNAAYDASKVDLSMANPTTGYFRNTLYVLYKDNTLTFCNDDSKVWREIDGKAYFFDENLPYTESPAWLEVEKDNVTKVVFEKSFKTVRPTNMMRWFYGFKNLTTIEGIENLCTDSVDCMLSTFSGCSSLTSIDLSHFNTKNVNVMQGMFAGCSALTTLDVSNFDMSKMIRTESMFQNCTALTTIYSSDDWNSSTLENSFLMFENCPKLKGADAYNANNTGASMANPTTGYFTAKTYVEYKDNTLTFYCDTKRASRSGTVYVLDENLPDAKSPAWLKEQKNVTKVVFDSSFKYSRPTTMSRWFYGFENLTTIEGMENLCTDSVVNMAYTFSGCSSLTSIDLSHFNTENVIVMAYMFEGCIALTTLDVSSFDMSKMINMESMFHECTALTTIYCNEDWDICSSTWEDGTGMFLFCTKLKGAVEYNEFYTGSSMANPTTGYFTKTAYVVENNGTLTFYCDTKRASRPGTSYSIHDRNVDLNYPAWAGDVSDVNERITKVVFDSSFKNYKPTSTERWFSYCTKIKTIEGIENLITDEVTDMSRMFSGCSALTSINMSNFNTENVTTMREMFSDCKALTSLDLSSFNTANVTDMNAMFFDCAALTKLDVSTFNTAKVTDMEYMFARCSALTIIFCDNNWNSGTVTYSDYMFNGCTRLKGAVEYDASKVDVSMANPTTGYFRKIGEITPVAYVVEYDSTLTFYYDSKKYTRIGYIYDINQKKDASVPIWAGKDIITKVVFDSSFKEYRPTTTASWFYSCKNLETVEGIEYLNTEEVTDMSRMFAGCNALTALDVSKFNTANVTNMSGMFTECIALTTLDLTSFNTANVTDMSGMFARSALTTLDLTSFNTAKVTDMSEMFAFCDKLTSLDLSKFNTANVTDMTSMFWACEALTTIYCNDDWTKGVVTESGSMFADCTNLMGAVAYDENNADVSMANPTTGYFTSKVYAVEDGSTLTFYYDENRKIHTGTVYDINAKRSENTNIPAWAGYNSAKTSITKVVFDSSFKEYKPTDTKYWFNYLTKLKTIEGIENLNTEQVTSMSYMFFGCESLTSLDVSHFNTANVTMMSFMFNGCQSLTSLDVSNFNTANVDMMTNMFGYCSALTSLDLSNFNTAKVTDTRYMFIKCSALTTIYCNDDWKSDKVTRPFDMFKGCTNLKGAVAYDATKVDVSMANPTTGYFTIRLRGKIGKGGYATFAVGDVQGTMSGNVEIFTATRNDGKVVLTSRTDYNLPVGGCVMLKGTPGETFIFTGNASAVPEAMPEGQVLTGGSNPYTVNASDDIFALATIDGNSAFYRVNTGVVIPAHKAYLVLTEAGAKSLTMVEMGDETTAIDSVTDSQEQSSAIYNLAGQRVEKMQRGIYIVNGKKVLKK